MKLKHVGTTNTLLCGDRCRVRVRHTYEYEYDKWVQYTKRTDDPKLAAIERLLDARGIPHRRRGESWHAPILQVPEQHLDAALAL